MEAGLKRSNLIRLPVCKLLTPVSTGIGFHTINHFSVQEEDTYVGNSCPIAVGHSAGNCVKEMDPDVWDGYFITRIFFNPKQKRIKVTVSVWTPD